MKKLMAAICSIGRTVLHSDIIFRNNFQLLISYDKQNNNILSKLCDVYGADKGEISSENNPYTGASHTYADLYNILFYSQRASVKRVFECGIGRFMKNSANGREGVPGASLRVWRDYFPNALVVGADINKDTLFEEERIKTYYIDQLSPAAIRQFWENVGQTSFDVILDDGLHTYDAGVCLFENSIEHLAEDGYYIIEDVHSRTMRKFQQYFRGTRYSVNYVMLTRNDHRYGDNNVVLIRKN